ncbi:MAG TPA: DivIVA domain-containing protein [Acidimicrobiales bacterium]|nr:DivIVA domain-containing protein [Acidimicrobiales bacterium]
MTGDVVRSVVFRQHRHGYHPDDVDEFLETVAWALDAHRRRIAELERATEDAPPNGRLLDLATTSEGAAPGGTLDSAAAEEQARVARQLQTLERRLSAERARLRRVLDEIGGLLGALSVMDPQPPPVDPRWHRPAATAAPEAERTP